MPFNSPPLGTKAPDDVDNEFEEEKAEEAEEAEDGDVLQELPSGNLFSAPPQPRPSEVNRDLSFASRLFDRGNKGFLTAAETGARRMAGDDGAIAPGAAVELVEGHRKLRSWAMVLAALSLALLAALVTVGNTLGNEIREGRRATIEQVDASAVTKVKADEQGDVHLVDKNSGSELTVRADGDSFKARTVIDRQSGRELACLPIGDVAAMVHGLGTATRGSLAVQDKDGIEKKVLSTDGDFEDKGAYLQFGSFRIRLDSDACSFGGPDQELDEQEMDEQEPEAPGPVPNADAPAIDVTPALESAAAVEGEDVPAPSSEDGDGVFNRRLRNPHGTPSEARKKAAPTKATRKEAAPAKAVPLGRNTRMARAAALAKNRRAYVQAHDAIKHGRELFLDDFAEVWIEIGEGVIDYFDGFFSCLEEGYSKMPVWGDGEFTIGFPAGKSGQCNDVFASFISSCMPWDTSSCVIIMRNQEYMDEAGIKLNDILDTSVEQLTDHYAVLGVEIPTEILAIVKDINANLPGCPLEFQGSLSGSASAYLEYGDEDEDDVSGTFHAQISAQASINGMIEMELQMSKVPIPVLESFFLSTDVTVMASGHLEFNATGSGSYEEEIELGPKKVVFRKFIMLSQFPLLLEIHAQPMFFFEATAEAEGYLSVKVASQINAAIRVDFDLFDLDLDADVTISGSPFDVTDVYLEGSFEASAAGRLGARFTFSANAHSVDVDVAAALSTTLSMETAIDSSGDSCVKGGIGFYGGLEARASFDNPLNPLTSMGNACKFGTGLLSAILDVTTPFEMCVVPEEFESVIEDRNKFINEVCDDIMEEVESLGVFDDPCVTMILDAPTTDWMSFVGFELEFTLESRGCQDEVGKCASNKGAAALEGSVTSGVSECFSSLGFDDDGKINVFGLSGSDGGCERALDKFEEPPLQGYCRDDQDSQYAGIYTQTVTVGLSAEGCAAWCQSFRAPGFVGFMLGGNSGNFCACRYSGRTLPKKRGALGQVQTSSAVRAGSGPIARGDQNANVQCYRVKKYIGPLDFFTQPQLGGYCRDSQDRMYGGVFTALSNLGADPEACAAWCLSFRVPGFAGFMYGGTTGTKYCICRYSQYTVPQAPKETFDVMRQLSTGKGPIDHASGTDGVQCYKVAKYVSPLADFEKPRDGYCRDSKFRGYTKLYTLRNNIGGNAEDCAAWCSSFGVGGFVGIALDASYCYCTYSKYTVPAAPVANFEVIPSESHFSGMGEVGKGSGWAGASCYKIKKYRSPPVAIVIGAAMADELDLELDLSHLMIEGYEPTLADVMQAVQYAEIQKVLQDIEDKAEETQQAKEQIVDVQSAANQQIQQTEQEVVDLFSAAEQQTQQQIQDLFSNQDPLALFFP